MKSKKIILLLFILVSSNVSSFDSAKMNTSPLLSVEEDTTYIYNKIKFKYLSIQQLVDQLVTIENKGGDFSDEELRQLALGYAQLDNPHKSIKYTQIYINRVFDASILKDNSFQEIQESVEYKTIADKYLPRMSIGAFFFFACGLIGVFLSIVLNLRSKGDTISNILISVFVLFQSLFIIQGGLFLSRNNFSTPDMLFLTTSLALSFGPLLYFYFKRISERYIFKSKDILHLVFPLLAILYFLPFYFLPYEEKLGMVFNSRESSSFRGIIIVGIILAKVVSLIYYSILIYKVYRKKLHNKVDSHIIHWQRNMMWLSFGYVLLYLVFVAARLNLFAINISVYPQVFALSLVVLYIGYIAFVQPRVFSKKFLFNEVSLLKYKNSGLTTSFSEELKEQLMFLLNKEKIYKQSDINLGDLAEKLDTTKHNISQVINEHFEMNFFHLINKYRIAEAIEIFKNDFNRNLNIIEVAYDVGFNNKVTFNKAFKEELHMTPSEFLREQRGIGLSTK